MSDGLRLSRRQARITDQICSKASGAWWHCRPSGWPV